MSKTDYSDAEKQISKSIQQMRIKSLVEGKTVNSERSMAYYGLEGEDIRPVQEDPVMIMLSQEAAKEENPETAYDLSDEEQLFLEASSANALLRDIMLPVPPQSKRFPKKIPPNFSQIAPSEKYLERASALYTLRQHILWLKKNNIENRYQLLKTTLEEVYGYRIASKLSDANLQRVKEINIQAETVIKDLLRKKKMESDEDLIATQQKQHKTKRFNIKDTWIPL